MADLVYETLIHANLQEPLKPFSVRSKHTERAVLCSDLIQRHLQGELGDARDRLPRDRAPH